jgi:hypothetical protein
VTNENFGTFSFSTAALGQATAFTSMYFGVPELKPQWRVDNLVRG